jgi:hypothetical protein
MKTMSKQIQTLAILLLAGIFIVQLLTLISSAHRPAAQLSKAYEFDSPPLMDGDGGGRRSSSGGSPLPDGYGDPNGYSTSDPDITYPDWSQGLNDGEGGWLYNPR